MSKIKADVIVDASGLLAPLPFLRAKKALVRLRDGEVLGLVATDPSVISDIQRFTARLGLELIDTVEKNGSIEFYMRK